MSRRGHREKAPSRRRRIVAQLADLKMPGALESLDEALAGVDGGEFMAAALLDRLLHRCHIRQHPGQQLPDAEAHGAVEDHPPDGVRGGGRRESPGEGRVVNRHHPQPAPASVATLPPQGPVRNVPFSMPI
ncbi:MAG: hypothetical protein J4G12_02755 [Gemmatimonadetes bacterium]|nr:hypothetical protein [Gemmatimonadota bacterium]